MCNLCPLMLKQHIPSVTNLFDIWLGTYDFDFLLGQPGPCYTFAGRSVGLPLGPQCQRSDIRNIWNRCCERLEVKRRLYHCPYGRLGLGATCPSWHFLQSLLWASSVLAGCHTFHGGTAFQGLLSSSVCWILKSKPAVPPVPMANAHLVILGWLCWADNANVGVWCSWVGYSLCYVSPSRSGFCLHWQPMFDAFWNLGQI